MIERQKKRTARVGIFAVAHGTYFTQFEGLFENLLRYHVDLCGIVSANEVELIDFGMVDSNEKAYSVADQMMGARLDLVFCNMITYATSSVFAPIMRALPCPVVLLALQPRAAFDHL